VAPRRFWLSAPTFSRLAGSVSGLMGLCFLGAWLVGRPEYQQFGGRNMKTNSALCILVLGAVLVLLTRPGRARLVGRVLALGAATVGLLTLTQHLTGLDFGIDQLLAPDPMSVDVRHPNRMSPPAALSFLLLGLALALAPGPRRAVLASQLLCATALGVAGLTLIGYLYEASFLYRPTSFVRFSPYTATGVLLLASGTLVLRPEVGLALRFSGEGAGSLLARRLLLVIGLLPVLLGWFRLEAHRLGLFDEGAGTALMVIATIAGLAMVLFVLARSLDRTDERRAHSEAQLRQSSELIAALARAPTVAEVATATVEVGLSALGARAGSFMLLDDSGTQLEICRSQGYDDSVRDSFARIPLDADFPVCQAVRERRPVFISGAEEYLRRYPSLRADQVARQHIAWAALPLEGRDKVLGVIGLSYDTGVNFDGATRDHLMRLAWQCGQALERALLFDAQIRAEERLRQALAEAQQAREVAESASRAKDEFLAMLGHELRNPLSPIVSALHLMQLRGGTQLHKERATIERQVRHMVRLVDDLMDVSRITRGKIELRRQPVNLAGAINAALEVVSPLLEQQKHRLEIDVPPELELSADPERLSQIISNLLSNAAKYTEAGGDIRVTAREVQGQVDGVPRQVVLTVADTGAGIPADLLPRVFDLFVQGGRTIERAQGGLGLGLAIVRSLVQLHGGAVEVASPGPGQGSTFSVTFPSAATVTSSSLEAVASPAAPGGVRRRILVVDDNRDAAESLSEALESEGHEVRVAFDGASAVALGQEYRPSVVFLDIGLPVMDGYEVARKLRALDNGYRPLLVAISGYGQPSDRQRAIEAGFDQHLVKPVSVEITLALAASEPASA
jgi:signal transduction histidine kinase